MVAATPACSKTVISAVIRLFVVVAADRITITPRPMSASTMSVVSAARSYISSSAENARSTIVGRAATKIPRWTITW